MDDEWDKEDLFGGTAIAEEEPRIELNGMRVLPCEGCGGTGMAYGQRGKGRRMHQTTLCADCEGVAWFGIPAELPTTALPGSDLKVAVMAQRYRAGLPLWDDEDATHERKPL